MLSYICMDDSSIEDNIMYCVTHLEEIKTILAENNNLNLRYKIVNAKLKSIDNKLKTMREYTPFLHIDLMNESEVLEMELDILGDKLSVTTTLKGTQELYNKYNYTFYRYNEVVDKLRKIIHYEDFN